MNNLTYTTSFPVILNGEKEIDPIFNVGDELTFTTADGIFSKISSFFKGYGIGNLDERLYNVLLITAIERKAALVLVTDSKDYDGGKIRSLTVRFYH
jgi:hypothetical protein